MEGNETLRGRMQLEGRLLKEQANLMKKQFKMDANLQQEINSSKKGFKNLIWEHLGLHLGGFESLGKGLEPLGAY